MHGEVGGNEGQDHYVGSRRSIVLCSGWGQHRRRAGSRRRVGHGAAGDSSRGESSADSSSGSVCNSSTGPNSRTLRNSGTAECGRDAFDRDCADWYAAPRGPSHSAATEAETQTRSAGQGEKETHAGRCYARAATAADACRIGRDRNN